VKKKGTWEPAELGSQVKAELTKGLTKKETINEIFRTLR